MRTRGDPLPYLVLIAGILGIVLIVVASSDLAFPGDSPPEPSPRTEDASVTSGAPTEPTSHGTPSLTPSATVPPTDTSTAAPTLAPTDTPTSPPTATPGPIAISPPIVSSAGAMAYVEDGVLTVIDLRGPTVTTIASGVTHAAQAAAWAPDGRWLLYAKGEQDGATESAQEGLQLHAWDSETGDDFHWSLEGSGLPSTASDIRQMIWSPDGTRILARLSPDASSSGDWVLDMASKQAWSLPDSLAGAAAWMDEETLLYGGHEGDASRFLHVGPPAQPLTRTIAVDGPYALSPDRGYVASFWGQPGGGQSLQIQPLFDSTAVALSEHPTVTVSGHDPVWSPDGRWVAYGAEAIPHRTGEGPHALVADTQGPGGTQIFPGLLPMAWSPDSRLLAGSGCSDGTCTLSLVEAITRQVTNIASADALEVHDLAWSPDGAYLIYSVSGSDGGKDGLMLWNRGTSEQVPLMETGETGPLTDLQWGTDSCTLYGARRQEGTGGELISSAIWGVGPRWEDRWQIAPKGSEGLPSLLERLGQREGNLEAQLCPGPLLDDRRLIAYYGTPLGPGLGILGRNGITDTLRLLLEQAQAYQELDPAVNAIPTFHMVVTIADDFAGPDGDYNHRVSHTTIRPWIDSVEAAGGWSIVDLQPGGADPVEEIDTVEPLIREPHVHLAVDPEFIVRGDQVPGEDLGQITGSQVNLIQSRLDQLAREIGTRKMLVVHQFDDRMIEGKEAILDYPLVDLVWDADGFGGPGAKIADYNQYKMETGFEYGGFKIFYRYDEPVMTPEEVLSLEPSPVLVIYQ